MEQLIGRGRSAEYTRRVWRAFAIGSIGLTLGCGNSHDTPPSEPPHASAQRPAPSVAAAVIDDARAAASTAIADAPVEKAPVPPPTAASLRAVAATGTSQCSGNATRCTLRVTAKGIYVNGDPKSREQAVAACKRTVCALVAIEDNAPAGEWEKLQAALIRAGIPILMRGVVNDTECLNNPLAKGCN